MLHYQALGRVHLCDVKKKYVVKILFEGPFFPGLRENRQQNQLLVPEKQEVFAHMCFNRLCWLNWVLKLTMGF